MSSSNSSPAANPRIEQLRHAAAQAAAAGRAEDAAALWQQVLALAPEYPDALHFQGQRAMQRGDLRGAGELLERAARAAPRDVVIHLNLALVNRQTGNAGRELAALDGALAADPMCFPAALAKGALFERAGEPRRAAQIYKDAIAMTPADDRLSPSLAAMAANARKLLHENSIALEAHLRAKLETVPAGRGELPRRFEECLTIATGKGKSHVQQPLVLTYPRLPAIPFFDNADFPWLADIEAASDAIREELSTLLQDRGDDFAPYVNIRDGLPLNQWADLNRSHDWSTYFFWKDGKKIDEHCAQCPRTAEVLEAAPMVDISARAPTAFFSLLAPKSHIPPHTGATNSRLIVHLALTVPEQCGFRVGNDTREWEPGKAWIFDDTIEHEAWNRSAMPRGILIFDIWNPFLSPEERELIRALEDGLQDYYGSR